MQRIKAKNNHPLKALTLPSLKNKDNCQHYPQFCKTLKSHPVLNTPTLAGGKGSALACLSLSLRYLICTLCFQIIKKWNSHIFN